MKWLWDRGQGIEAYSMAGEVEKATGSRKHTDLHAEAPRRGVEGGERSLSWNSR